MTDRMTTLRRLAGIESVRDGWTQEKLQSEGPAISEASAPPALLLKIAKKHFDVDTLATQKSDRLDFHDVAVWSIEAALQDAYAAGLAAAKKG